MKNCLKIAALLNEEELLWLKGFYGPNWMLMPRAKLILQMSDCSLWYVHAVSILNKAILQKLSEDQ